MLQLSRHAVDKLATYGIQSARLCSWHEALPAGDPFLDVCSGASGSIFWWEQRPWIVIFSQDGVRVVTTYCGCSRWCHVLRHDPVLHAVRWAPRELWQQVANVDPLFTNPSVSEFSRREAGRRGSRLYREP
jgi:hypothetical protein